MSNQLDCIIANQAEMAENKTVLVSETSLLIGTEAEAAKDEFSPDLAMGVSAAHAY
jgi:hypothetical protein